MALQHRNRSPRYRIWDYTSRSQYFVTFCVAGRRLILGRIAAGFVHLTGAGRLVTDSWNHLPQLFPGIELDALCIMPDHVHAVIALPGSPAAGGRPLLGQVIAAWQARSTQLIRVRSIPDFQWQERYHDCVIRNRRAYERIIDYLRRDPAETGCW